MINIIPALLSVVSSIISKNNPNAAGKLNAAGTVARIIGK